MGALVGDPRLPTTPTPSVVDDGGELGPESGVLLQSTEGVGEWRRGRRRKKKEKVRNNVKRMLARFACVEGDCAPPLFSLLFLSLSLSVYLQLIGERFRQRQAARSRC